MENSRAEAIAEAIKNAEPAARIKGCTINWDRFNQQFESGQYSEDKLVPQAVENSLEIKIDK